MSARGLNVRELLELERQIYQESIERVQQQQEQLRQGVLEEFVQRCEPFEAARERELDAARAQLQLSRTDARSLLAFDLQQAEDVFQAERRQWKRQLLESTRRRREELETRLQALEAGGERRQKRVRTESSAETLETQLRRAQRHARRAFNLRHLGHGVMPAPKRIVREVLQECENLQRSREREEAARMAQEEGVQPKVHVEVSEDGKKLQVREGGEGKEKQFGVGDAVVLLSRLTDEEFHGFVSGISTEEVQLVLVCGSHVRVTLARLRSEQCKLRQQTEKPWSIESRKDGQEGYRSNLSSISAPTLEGLLRDPRMSDAMPSQL